MGASTENSAFKTTKNPHDTTRVAGRFIGWFRRGRRGAFRRRGARLRYRRLDPATLEFLRRRRPESTYGAVSRSGVIAMASSLDQVGPIAKTVEDAAVLFKAIAGKDPLDATSVDADYRKSHRLRVWKTLNN